MITRARCVRFTRMSRHSSSYRSLCHGLSAIRGAAIGLLCILTMKGELVSSPAPRPALGRFPLGTIVHGDSRALMTELPDACCGAIVADPPYSSGGTHGRDRARSTTAKYVQTGQKTISPPFEGDARDQRSWTRWSEFWLREAYRITRPGGVAAVFTDWRQLPSLTDAFQMAGWIWRGVAVWDKTEGTRPVLGRPRAQAEYIVWGSRGAMPLSGPTLPGVFRLKPTSDGSDHQTAKPVPVMRWLLGMVRSGPVLDPFAGGGATGVACHALGIPFLGFELTRFWSEYANARLEALGREPDRSPSSPGAS